MLPKVIEDIILSYKEEIDQMEKYKKMINPINNMKKRYLYQSMGETIDLQISIEEDVFLTPIYEEEEIFHEDYIEMEIGIYFEERIEKKELKYDLYWDWMCLDKNMEPTSYKDTEYYKSYKEIFYEKERDNKIEEFKKSTGINYKPKWF